MSKLAILCAALFISAPGVYGHCEIPCGIYGDDLRFAALDEDIRTVEKSMRQIAELSADPGANANQIARWVMNKEVHADRIRETVAQYFLAQRIKLPDEGDAAAVEAYRDQLARLHKLIVHAMKSKQTTDLAHPAALQETLKAFREAYEG
ncbi:MAG: hypothetical protein OXG13_13015 [Gemmatimonadaceae bacterium]|nr:hypothetical protein [Gemmatimonadaceae bacterium]